MPDQHVAEALFEALARHTALAGMSVLLPQANLARPALADLLRGAGAVVEACTAYETVRPEGEMALTGPVDAITFTSSSSVQHFVEMFAPDAIGAARVACIGPVTADTARALGLPVHIVAEPHTVEGLIAALCESFERNPTL
jgi:uroporphyrinogen-III synthase